MRREVLSLLLVVFLIGFVIAQETSESKVIKGYECLDAQVAEKTLSFEEAVFAGLANVQNDKIKNKVASSKSSSADCWPSGGCTLRDTALAGIVKDHWGEDTSGITDWLKSKTGSTGELTWFLQITTDNNNPASCKITYDGKGNDVIISEDMKLSGSPGSCLSISSSGYWLKINENCVEKTFAINCNGNFGNFKTNLLYQEKTGSGTVFVSSSTHSADSSSQTTEKVRALCFKKGAECDYEGSLWATAALYAIGKDTEDFVPYLKALAPNNKKYLPDAFIHFIVPGPDQFSKLIGQQKPGPYWEAPNSARGSFYDSALGMLALGGANSQGGIGTGQYLLQIQGTNGCWNNNNLRDTAFILYSGWARISSGGGGGGTATNCLANPRWLDSGGNIISTAVGWESGRKDGSEIYFGVSANNPACVGKSVTFEVFEDDQLEDQSIGKFGTVSIDSEGFGFLKWDENPKWFDDSEFPGEDNPEFYFIASASGIANSGKSALLTATRPGLAINPFCKQNEGIWVDKNEISHDGTKVTGFCNLNATLMPRGCCPLGYACNDEGNGFICDDGSDGAYCNQDNGLWIDVNGVSHNSNSETGFCNLNTDLLPRGCCAEDFKCVDKGQGPICDDSGLGTPIDPPDFNESRGGDGIDGIDPFAVTSCSRDGYYCVADGFECLAAGGEVIESAECSNFVQKCCTVQVIETPRTCFDLRGQVCSSDKRCETGEVQATDGLCCLSGCVIGGGGPDPVIPDPDPDTLGEGGIPTWAWIVLLIVLIGLVVLGIVYRDKLRVMLFKFRKKGVKQEERPPNRGIAYAGRPGPRFGRGMPPRRPVSFRGGPPPMRRPTGLANGKASEKHESRKSDKEKEMDETMKKLKKMSE
jgi:hypothetical protein